MSSTPNPMEYAQHMVECIVASFVDDPDAVVAISDDAMERAYWVALRVLSELGPGWHGQRSERARASIGGAP